MREFLPLSTERLTLRPLVLADAAAVRRYASDERVARWTARIPHPYPDGAAEAWIAETHAQMARGDGWQLGIERPGHGVIGAVSLEHDEDGISAELGYVLAVDHWGHGYGTEAARRMIAFAFESNDLAQVHARVLPGNTASRRVLDKVGFAFVGPATVTLEARGRNAEVECYALERRAWRG
jgi:RimJ/RimL family protein N-acetyltransferase